MTSQVMLNLNRRHRSPGFSFIEVLTALIIFGILSGYSLSLMPSLHRKNQLEVMANEIKQAIHFAKIEALTHAHTITLTPLSEDADWSAGMLLFVDNNIHHYTPKTTLIREWHWHSKALNVTWHGFESSHYLRFSPDLLERGANGHFVVQDNEKHQIKLVVNRLARVREETTSSV